MDSPLNAWVETGPAVGVELVGTRSSGLPYHLLRLRIQLPHNPAGQWCANIRMNIAIGEQIRISPEEGEGTWRRHVMEHDCCRHVGLVQFQDRCGRIATWTRRRERLARHRPTRKD